MVCDEPPTACKATGNRDAPSVCLKYREYMRTGNASTAVHLRVLMVEILPALALAGMPNPEASEKNLG